MRYTYGYFRDSMPEWKRKKDPINCRYCVRPLSFFGSAFCANHGISANDVSYLSAVIAIISCVLYFFKPLPVQIMGALLINIWLWMDCVDGNLARSVEKQPFGEFADAISSYILVAFMGVSFGYSVFVNGGLFLEPGNPWAIVIGAVSSVFDTLIRLIYQKYKNTERDLTDKGILSAEVDDHTDHSKVGSFRIWFEQAWGIGGWLPHFILVATIFKAMDVILIYCFFYFGASFFGGVAVYIKRAMVKAKGVSFHDED